MPAIISKLIAAFKAELGTTEVPKGSNNVIYNTHYYGHAVSGDSYPWCCVFIWDIFRMLGYSGLFCGGEKTAYCPYVVTWAKNHGMWVTGGYQKGDILLFDWDNDGKADHIGFCVGCSGSTVMSIEGNTSNSVGQRNYTVGNVMGAYRPNYPNDSNNDSANITPISTVSDGKLLNDDGTYTVKSGESLISIAKKTGFTYLELAKANNINPPYTIRVGQILKMPTGKEEVPVSKTETTNNDGKYIVKTGDNLWMIGQKLGIPYLEIAKLNGITSPYVIRPGQVLVLPGSKQQASYSESYEITVNVKDTTPDTDDKTYTVKPGDSLWGIAKDKLGSGGRWNEIKELNNLSNNVIRPGQVLRIP